MDLLLDLSFCQTQVNWDLIKKPITIGADTYTVKGVYIKASEGATVKDAMRGSHAVNVKQAGLLFGYYHFLRPVKDLSQAQVEVNNFLAATSKMPQPTLTTMFDIEANDAHLSPADYTQYTRSFLEIAKNAIEPNPIIYGGPYFLQQMLQGDWSQYRLWLAEYGIYMNALVMPKNFSNWNGWQFTGTGKHPAVIGNVDMSLFKDINDIAL